MSDFMSCFTETEVYEGWHKFSNNRDDPGGATYSGVTQSVWDAYCLHRHLFRSSVRTMTDEQCEDLYQVQYWAPIMGDSLPKGLDLSVYDEAVNSGVVTAIKALQRILNVQVDGHMGVVTLAATGKRTVTSMIEDYNDQRLSFLHRLRTWKFFSKGWTTRVNSICAKSKAMVQKGGPGLW